MQNNRAKDMFALIEKSIVIHGASIIDLGCGYGDIMLYAIHAGAHHVYGVDLDISRAFDKMEGIDPCRWTLDEGDISTGKLPTCKFDIAICTSVLPYIENRDAVLDYMAKHATTSFIEMQYYGDGPGPEDIQGASDMRAWLSKHFNSIRLIGCTATGRSPIPYRDIWRCD